MGHNNNNDGDSTGIDTPTMELAPVPLPQKDPNSPTDHNAVNSHQDPSDKNKSTTLTTTEISELPDSDDVESIQKNSINPKNGQKIKNVNPKKDNFPLTIAYRNASISVRVPATHTPLPNIITPIKRLISNVSSCCTGKVTSRDFFRLKDASGVIKPGMTLVLSPPGHGKSTFLKMVSSILPTTGGTMTYNGVPKHLLSSQGTDIQKLVMYQEQTDNHHFTFLNVHETIELSSQFGSIYGDDADRVQEIIDAFGLDECKSTLIGDAVVKGISGGQKRRVSTAVGLSSDAVCLCLDQYSDGLDSAVTERITEYLSNWTKTNETSVVATLQQPTPSVFGLFDTLVLLREGQVVYHGPRGDVLPYLEAIGFKCRDDVDTCDFIIDVLSQPRQALYNFRLGQLQEAKLAKKKANKKTTTTITTTTTTPHNSLTTSPQTSTIGSTDSIVGGESAQQEQLRQQEQLLQLQKDQLSSKPTKGKGLHKQAKLMTSLGELHPSPTPCLNTEEMVQYFHTTQFWSDLNRQLGQYIPEIDKVSNNNNVLHNNDDFTQNSPDDYHYPFKSNVLLNTPLSRQKYSNGFRLPFLTTMKFSIKRQVKILDRGKWLLITKWINSFSLAFFAAALFYQVPRSNPNLRVGAILLSMSQSIYNNMIELANTNNDKRIVMNQLQSSMYPPIAYVLSAFFCSLPFHLFDSFIFTMIYYFLENFYLGFAEIVMFWFIIVLTGIVSWAWFRFVAILMPDLPSSFIVASPTVSYFTTLSGFYIARSQIPGWFIWLYWISPYSWLVRMMSINEFMSSAYDQIVVNAVTGQNDRMGNALLDYVDIYSDELWQLWGTMYILAFTGVFLCVQALLLMRTPPEPTIGTRRVKEAGEDDLDLNNLEAQFTQDEANEERQQDQLKQLTTAILHTQKEHASKAAHSTTRTMHKSATHKSTTQIDENAPEVSVSHLSRTQMSSIVRSTVGGNNGLSLKTLTEELPFYPTSISFSDIQYTVRVADLQGKTSDRVLLNGISGSGHPGDLIALMGASGAGKTTLLNVLCGLIPQTNVKGTILFNGVELKGAARGVITGYVQQFATLWGFSSVEETLLYAARLRMDKSISEELKKKVVEEIMDVLELTPIRNYIIGNVSVPGLSPSQIKRVSIGVELVANPAVIFFDEPTSMLDSKQARTVLRVIQRIAKIFRRTCILTIHQPSSELYFFFSKLYLLAPGGHQVYGGDVGYRSRDFVKWFSTIPGISPIQARSNPANWMLIESSKAPDPLYVSLEYVKEKTTIMQNNNIETDEDWEAVPLSKKWILYLKWHYFHTSVAWWHLVKDLNRNEEIFYTQNPDLIAPKRALPDKLTQKQLDQLHEEEKIEQVEEEKFLKTLDSIQDAGADQETFQDKAVVPAQADVEPPDAQNDQPNTLQLPRPPSIFFQFRHVFARHFTLYFRNPGAMLNRLLVLLTTSIITGLIYLNFTIINTSSVISYMACIIMVTGTFCFNIANSTVPLYISCRPIFYREKGQGFYTYPWIWSLANTFNELVWCIGLCIVGAIPVWFMVGYPTHAVVFFKYLLSFYITISTFISAQQFFSSAVPNITYSGLCTALLTGAAFMTNGIGTTLAQLKAISPLHEALYWILPLGPLNLFLSDTIFGVTPEKTVSIIDTVTGEQKDVLLYGFAQSFFGFNPDRNWFYLGVIVIQWFGWQLLYHLVTTFVHHGKS
jgi:ABC-type multidrug transport system ATPase subunit